MDLHVTSTKSLFYITGWSVQKCTEFAEMYNLINFYQLNISATPIGLFCLILFYMVIFKLQLHQNCN